MGGGEGSRRRGVSGNWDRYVKWEKIALKQKKKSHADFEGHLPSGKVLLLNMSYFTLNGVPGHFLGQVSQA